MKFLIVVDAQNDFITGPLAPPNAEEVARNIFDKIYDFDGLIVYTVDTHHEDYLDTQEGQKLPIEHCIKGTEGWFVEDMISQSGSLKTRYYIWKETFGSTDLPYFIADHSFDEEVEEIELVGYVLDICVISNALLLKAHFPETKISVDVSCCAATSDKACEAAKIILKSCQIEVKE